MGISSWGRWTRLYGVSVAWLCLLALLLVDGVVPRAFAEDPPVDDPAPEVSAPVAPSSTDFPSALIQARANGKRVEVTGERSESSTTWVNPDGSVTTEQFAAPVRFQDPGGDWQRIDTTLEEQQDGSVAPVAVPDGIELAGSVAGTEAEPAEVASLDAGDDTAWNVALAWGGDLPAPVLEGSTATYAGAWPGIDLTVTASRDGFEQSFVITDREALAGYVESQDAAAGTEVFWEIPLLLTGVTAREVKGERIEFVDPSGEVVSMFEAPMAWDAEVDQASLEHVNHVPVTAGISSQEGGVAVLRLGVDRAWLTDQSRVFPVTVDPVYATVTTRPTFDAYVQSNISTDRSSELELKAGTYDGTNVARSYLVFAQSPFKNLKILSASLNVYETWSYSCTASGLEAWSVGSPVTSSVRWSNKPALVAKQGSVTTAKGFNSTCAAGWVNIPITGLAQSWSTSTASSVTLALRATSETSTTGWKRFASAESTNPPSITFTYDRKPNQASMPTVSSTGTYNNVSYAWQPRPVVSTTVTDPDGNLVRANIEVHSSTTASASTLVTECDTPLGASGATISCTLPANLPNNATLYVRAAVADELGVWNGTWSPWKTVKTAQTKPSAPQITCNVASGSWATTQPASTLACSVVITQPYSTSSPITVRHMIDGATTETLIPIAQGPRTVALPPIPFTQGAHRIRVRVSSPSTMASDPVTFQTGWGGPSVINPAPKSASNGKFAVDAAAPPLTSTTQTVTALQQWRLAGTADAWTSVGTAQALTGAVGTPLVYRTTFDAGVELAAAGNTSRAPVRLEYRICFTYSGITNPLCTDATRPTTLVKVPHAFGGGYPTADVEAGQVALYTGEFQTSSTDVSVPGYGSDISISRTHLSYTGTGPVTAWPNDPVTGVFGPGFTANLEGDDAAGLAGLQVMDSRMDDGTISLLDEEGEPLVFVNPTGDVGTPVPVVLLPGTEDTELAGITATLTGTAAAPKLEVLEDDGTKTTFTPVAGGANKNLTWRPASIAEPGQAGSTTFGHDPTTGAVTRVVAPLPDGIAGTACPTAGTLQPGCRAIDLTYITVTDPSGAQAQRLSQVSAVLFDPATATMKSTPVTTYQYDSSTRLSKVTDVRSGLATAYTWDGTTTRIKTITPSGLAPFTIAYAANPDTSIPTQVVKNVTRAAQTSDGAPVQIASIVYHVPVTGTGLPDLSDAGIAAWVKDEPGSPEHAAQKPVNGYAVFSSDHPVTGLTGSTVPATDLQYASLQYVNADAYTINTASYGAGDWQVTATRYDEQGNVVRELDEQAIRIARSDSALSATAVDALSTQTVYNTERKAADGTVILPAGSVVTDTYGPARDVMLADGVTMTRARPHTKTVYDGGAPNAGVNATTGQAYALATTVTVDAVEPGSAGDSPAVIETIGSTKNGYAPIDGKPVTDPTSGWVLGVPTTVTNPAGQVTKQRFDARGKVLEQRQPASSGTDAGTTRTIYYTAAANADDASCGASNQAKAWAGEVCRIFPAAAPSSGPTMPGTKITGYDYWLAPTMTVETSGAATRTSEVKYDVAGRAIWTRTSTSGLAGSVATDPIFTQYNQTTGLVTAVGVSNSMGTGIGSVSESYTYDTWGKQLTLTNQLGETTTTTYDAKARVTQIVDAKGTTAFTYDGTDANGNAERRGLITKQTVTRSGTQLLTYEAAYDAAGNMVTEKLPAGIIATRQIDEAGEETGLVYSGKLTDPDTGTVTTGPWIAWSQANDITGRVRTDQTTFASAIATDAGLDVETEVTEPTGGNPLFFDHRYTYDAAGNLSRVEDLTGKAVPGNDVSPYTVRDYTFTTNGARKTLKETVRADGTTTGAATTGIDQTLTYDTADRLTGGYVYDLFGRQTTLPAAHAPNNSAGNVTLGYFDNDLPQKIAQGGTSTTFTLDVNQRRLVQSSTSSAGTTTTTRHYADGSDNPAWIDTQRPDGAVETLRYTSSISGDLGASIGTDGGTSLMLGNIHGDIVTTIPIPATQAATTPATGITGWSSYTEYGTPIDPAQTAAVGTTAGYGWLGAKERSTTPETAGLTLMGVRYYSGSTGSFTSIDPILGANSTAYIYPSDPENIFDTDGRGPYGSCFMRSKSHVLAKYWSKFDGTVKMECGTSTYGMRHIIQRHRSDWLRTIGGRGDWKKFMDWGIRQALSNPAIAVSQTGGKRCYSAPLVMYRYVNGKPVYWKTRWANVVVSKYYATIITAFPSRTAYCK
ncbi:DNRLRE domain-containing protein [Brachybacterium hainanense]|uniref:DNRLRE domain-containing protein n=1 Tax=Brachybacterium hainanense TaxID=1541174 RepID=A0ABV6RF79_9MICO